MTPCRHYQELNVGSPNPLRPTFLFASRPPSRLCVEVPPELPTCNVPAEISNPRWINPLYPAVKRRFGGGTPVLTANHRRNPSQVSSTLKNVDKLTKNNEQAGNQALKGGKNPGTRRAEAGISREPGEHMAGIPQEISKPSKVANLAASHWRSITNCSANAPVPSLTPSNHATVPPVPHNFFLLDALCNAAPTCGMPATFLAVPLCHLCLCHLSFTPTFHLVAAMPLWDDPNALWRSLLQHAKRICLPTAATFQSRNP